MFTASYSSATTPGVGPTRAARPPRPGRRAERRGRPQVVHPRIEVTGSLLGAGARYLLRAHKEPGQQIDHIVHRIDRVVMREVLQAPSLMLGPA